MAHFRAYIQGVRGEASRLGTKNSGMLARVQTWGYDVIVNVSHFSDEDVAHDRTLGAGDWAEIEMVKHGASTGKLLARVNLTTGEVI